MPGSRTFVLGMTRSRLDWGPCVRGSTSRRWWAGPGWRVGNDSQRSCEPRICGQVVPSRQMKILFQPVSRDYVVCNISAPIRAAGAGSPDGRAGAPGGSGCRHPVLRHVIGRREPAASAKAVGAERGPQRAVFRSCRGSKSRLKKKVALARAHERNSEAGRQELHRLAD